MKKFLPILIVFSLICLFIDTNSVKAKYTNYVYARVQTSGIYLYKSTNPTPQNSYFEIPATYFVLLLSNYDANFYKAQYRDYVGYVLKKEVTPVNETPQTPFLETQTFRVYSSDGTGIKSSPFDNGIVIGQVKELEEINYYGSIIGREEIDKRGSVWAYGKTSNGQAGYFYCGLIDGLENIPINTESTTILENPFEENSSDYLYNLVDITPIVKILIIGLVTIPAIAILWLIFLPNTKRLKPKGIKVSKPQPIKQIQDYNDDLL